MSNIPWFIDLTFQVRVQYCSWQHCTLLSLPDTSTTEQHIHFGPVASFFLKLLVIALCSSPVAYWTPSDLGRWWCGNHFLVSYLSTLSYCLWGFSGRNTGVVCHSLLQWTTFCQNSLLWRVHLGWPCMAWLITSLSYANQFTTTRLWSMKGWLNAMAHKLVTYIMIMDREAWRAAIHGVAKSRTWLSDWTELNWTELWPLRTTL